MYEKKDGLIYLFPASFSSFLHTEYLFVIVYLQLIVFGVSLLLYNGIEELSSLHQDFTFQINFLTSPSVTLFFIGFLTGLHLTTSSPIYYQV